MTLTTEQWAAESTRVHSGKYDYSKSVYTGARNYLTVICPIHGEFQQQAYLHKTGAGCPKCADVKTSTRSRWTLERFIEAAREKHGDRFDYSKFIYSGYEVKGVIVCPEHGEFLQTPAKHLTGKTGCPKCGTKSQGERHSKGTKAMGRRKLTTEEWIEKAKNVHGDKYDYSKVVYEHSQNKVIIVCKEHGEFEQVAKDHLRGIGCHKCAVVSQTLTTEEWIEKAKKVHGDKYDYSETIYYKSCLPIVIVCKIHGKFEQIAGDHLKGSGCPRCSINRRTTPTDKWIERARAIHGEVYDYSYVIYKRIDDKVTIICPEHGPFVQEANNHLKGQGCPKCAGNAKLSVKEWIEKARAIHGDTYDYSKVAYENSNNKVTIICREHGKFEQAACNHLQGNGCARCAADEKYSTTEEWVKKARSIHGDIYDYSEVRYTRSKDKVIIICLQHGAFSQEASSHLRGCGCPHCNPQDSKGERELYEFVSSLVPDAYRSDRALLAGKELDIVIPSLKMAIEYNGIYYHSEKFLGHDEARTKHAEKTRLAAQLGIRLLHIYEDDWKQRRSTVEHTLRHIFGLTERTEYARKCKVEVVSHSTAVPFFAAYHMQGPSKGGLNLALVKDGEILAIMTFGLVTSVRGVSDPTYYELKRFASKCTVIGGASKLLKHFLKTTPEVKTLVSYSDNDLFTGGVYSKLGFTFSGEVKPDYKVVIGNQRVHKAKVRLSGLEKMFPETFDPNLSEHQNCLNHGIYRIYNSGLKRWVIEL